MVVPRARDNRMERHVRHRGRRDRGGRSGHPLGQAVSLRPRRRMRDLRAPLRRVPGRRSRAAHLLGLIRPSCRRGRARARTRRRGHRAGAHLHGDGDLGALGRRDPGDRRYRRIADHRPGRHRGRDRTRHQGGDPRPPVGRGLRHGRDYGDRAQARPFGARRRVHRNRRRVRGPHARHHRPRRRIQLQLLQEHHRRRRRRRRHQRSRDRQACGMLDRSLPPLLDRAHARHDAVRRQRRPRLRDPGRRPQRPARPPARHDRGHAHPASPHRRGHPPPRQPWSPTGPDA